MFETNPLVFWLVVAAVFLIIIAGILFAFRKWMERRCKSAADLPIIYVKSDNLKTRTGLLSFVKGIMQRFLHFLIGLLSKTFPRRTKPIVEDMQSLSARAIYRSLLDWAFLRGMPRSQSQTPLEFLDVLCRSLPQIRDELAIITSVYQEARYSQNQENDAEVSAARSAWQQIKFSS